MSADIEAWARTLAATLPPLKATEANDIGRLASVLDIRRRSSRSPNRETDHAAGGVRDDLAA